MSFFISSPVAALPSSLPPRSSPPLTPPPRRRGTTGCIGSVQLFNQFLQLCFGGFRKQAREVCHHSFIGLLGRPFANTSLATQQAFRCGEQRPTETILAAVLIDWVDEILGHDACGHLQPTHIAIELRTHVLTREVAGGSQFTCNHTTMLTKRRKDDILDGSFLRGSIFAPPPIAEVGPPLTANKACLASEELAVDAASLAHHSSLPLPQRPFPRAIGKPSETALISHKRFGIIAIDATIQQRQKSHHVHTLHQLRTGMNASLHASAEDKLSVLGTAVEDVACFVFHFRCSV